MIAGLSPPAAYILAATMLCPTHPAPTVTISLAERPPIFVNNISTTQLTQQKVDTVVPRKSDEVFTTGGITNGKISAGFKIGYRRLVNPQNGEACLWSDKIEVNVNYEPTVYIASEYKSGSCRYNSIAEHEMRHVTTDVITIRQYIPSLRDAIRRKAETFGTQLVRLPADIPARQQAMSDSVQETMTRVADQMERARAQRQQQIDTRAEYLRLSNMCR